MKVLFLVLDKKALLQMSLNHLGNDYLTQDHGGRRLREKVELVRVIEAVVRESG